MEVLHPTRSDEVTELVVLAIGLAKLVENDAERQKLYERTVRWINRLHAAEREGNHGLR